jgi:hypothetical protein
VVAIALALLIPGTPILAPDMSSSSQTSKKVPSFYLSEGNISGDDGRRCGSRNHRHSNGGKELLHQRSEKAVKDS